MSKLSKVLFALWIVLAIVCFVCAFFTMPVFVRALGIIFGILNLSIIMSWGTAVLAARKEYKKQKKLLGE